MSGQMCPSRETELSAQSNPAKSKIILAPPELGNGKIKFLCGFVPRNACGRKAEPAPEAPSVRPFSAGIGAKGAGKLYAPRWQLGTLAPLSAARPAASPASGQDGPLQARAERSGARSAAKPRALGRSPEDVHPAVGE